MELSTKHYSKTDFQQVSTGDSLATVLNKVGKPTDISSFMFYADWVGAGGHSKIESIQFIYGQAGAIRFHHVGGRYEVLLGYEKNTELSEAEEASFVRKLKLSEGGSFAPHCT